MELVVREIESFQLVALVHRGPYPTIGETFGELAAVLSKHEVRVGDFVGVYYDDPSTTPVEKLRAHAGAIVKGEVDLEDTDFEMVTVPGGRYATAVHVGSYEKMGDAWMELYGSLMPAAGLQPNPEGRAPFERYIKDCDVEGMDKAETRLYVPI